MKAQILHLNKRIRDLLDIIHTQNERIDVLSERIDIANKRIEQLRESVEYDISLLK